MDIIGSYSDKPLNVEQTTESEPNLEYGIIADTQHSKTILNWANATDIKTGLASLIKC